MTIGDILAVIAAVLATAGAWGALVLMVGLLCPARTERARAAIVERPGRCFAQGLGVAVVLGVLGIIVGQSAAGPLKIIAGALWGSLALMAALGGAAIAQIAGERIGNVGSHMAPFAQRTRAVALFVGAGLTPIVGWFVVTPVAALIGIGAAVSALKAQDRVSEPVAATPVFGEIVR
ncbi:hypothetical protein CCAX7_65560 [Capsulimonas corticalis]|uniref:Uncharacterized protein n=1 Tax=Capsulimonas corticalis TaxID=2219043 RepID=A0A402CR48_9BACT|nr:hypothetical protein [Capsulimonas corticalis]BDI34505.1 hypothetical protein CCAX7_65560 [Capsulimonas corticalis]